MGGGDRDLFHGGEIDLEARAIVAEGVADNDFAPLVGQVVDLLEILGGEFTGGHGLNLLAVRAARGEEWGPVVVHPWRCLAKRFLHSSGGPSGVRACETGGSPGMMRARRPPHD
jgi:hypothetical protein